MKICDYCGRDNEDGAVCCRECGTSEFSSATAPKIVPRKLPKAKIALGIGCAMYFVCYWVPPFRGICALSWSLELRNLFLPVAFLVLWPVYVVYGKKVLVPLLACSVGGLVITYYQYCFDIYMFGRVLALIVVGIASGFLLFRKGRGSADECR